MVSRFLSFFPLRRGSAVRQSPPDTGPRSPEVCAWATRDETVPGVSAPEDVMPLSTRRFAVVGRDIEIQRFSDLYPRAVEPLRSRGQEGQSTQLSLKPAPERSSQ